MSDQLSTAQFISCQDRASLCCRARGALRAAGFSTSLCDHFFDTLRFIDPGLSTESSVFANGLHFADSSSHLLVKNISDAPIAVAGRIYQLDRTQSIKPLAILSKPLAPGESAELELPRTTHETLEGAAVRLDSSGTAATMIAVFTSVESTHRIARSVPFVDTSDRAALTGGYPWRIDGDYTSTVLITNIARSRAAIAGFIRPSGGKDYKIDTRYIEPGETAVFDIRQIRDQQIPDPKGVKLPRNVTAGQFEWSSILGDGSQRLVGRADITSLSQAVSSPPTYYQCNCPLSAISAFISPGNAFVGVGGQAGAQTEIQYEDVCDGDMSYDPFAVLSWTIQNPPVLSLTTKQSPSTMTGLSGGVSQFSTTFTAENLRFSPSNGCQSSYVQLKPTACGSVIEVKNVAPSPLVVGSAGPMAIQGSGFLNLPQVTVTLSGSGVTVSAPTVNADGTLITASYTVASGIAPGLQNLTASSASADGGKGASSKPFPVTISALSSGTVTGISPQQGLIGSTLSNVTITGTGFGSSPTVNAGNGITVTYVSRSDTSITANFAVASNAPAGNNSVIVTTTSGYQLQPVNFYVQIPTHFQFYTVPGAPGGKGPVMPVTNGTVYYLNGSVDLYNYCGVYENFAYEFLDQQSNPILNETGTVKEVFSNISPLPGPNPSVNIVNFATQGNTDLQAYGGTYPNFCLGTNQNQSLDYTYTVQVGSTVYPLITVVHITKGKFNGTPNVTATIKTP